MHQPLFGASFPFLLALAWYLRHQQRASLPLLVATPCAMLACAIWAVVPDIPRLTGNLEWYHRLQTSAWSNVFFLHHIIDRIEVRYLDVLTPLFNTLFVAMVLLLLLAAWRELQHTENAISPSTPTR